MLRHSKKKKKDNTTHTHAKKKTFLDAVWVLIRDCRNQSGISIPNNKVYQHLNGMLVHCQHASLSTHGNSSTTERSPSCSCTEYRLFLMLLPVLTSNFRLYLNRRVVHCLRITNKLEHKQSELHFPSKGLAITSLCSPGILEDRVFMFFLVSVIHIIKSTEQEVGEQKMFQLLPLIMERI